MMGQRKVMDAEAEGRELDALTSTLPPGVRQVVGLQRRGVNVSPQDLETPEQAQARIKADEDNDVRKAGRIAAVTRAPREGGGSSEQTWVIRNGQPTPIPRGTAQPGDTPYDAVAARQPTAPDNSEAVETATELVRVAEQLRDHPSRGSVFGTVEGALPSFRQGSIDAQTLVDQLNGLLALENMGKMKGVLSDKDMAMIRQASSRLSNQRIGDQAAYQELSNIIQTVNQRIGGSGGASPQPEEPRMGRTGAPGAQGGPRFKIIGGG
jgi:hypothetical protein